MKLNVYYSANNCQPCKAMAKIIEQAVKDGIEINKININEGDGLDSAVAHNVSSVPTFIRYDGDTEVDRHVGSMDYNSLVAMFTR